MERLGKRVKDLRPRLCYNRAVLRTFPQTAQGVRMNSDPAVVVWPDYQEFYRWLREETSGLTDACLDFDSQNPEQEWMWWSIRRQMSHIACVLLVFSYRRCHTFLWPDGNIPAPIRWEDHVPMSASEFDRRLDPALYWDPETLLEKTKIGVDWVTQVCTTVPAETLRTTYSVSTGTAFWGHVMQVIPRGAWVDEQDPNRFHYTLEASLWMLYWEVLAHLYTIQRLKRAQNLATSVEVPLVGYLTLPEYTGETSDAAPPQTRLR